MNRPTLNLILTTLTPIMALSVRKSSIAFAQAQNPPISTAQPAQTAPAKTPPAPKGALRGSFHEPDPIDWENHEGYQQIFDGVSLKNWVGDPSV